MTTFNPYQPPRLDASGPGHGDNPGARDVDDPLVDLEMRIMNQRNSVATGTLVVALLMFFGAGLLFILIAPNRGEPPESFKFVVALGATLNGILVLWSLILGLVGVGAFLNASGFCNAVRFVHSKAIVLETLALGATVVFQLFSQIHPRVVDFSLIVDELKQRPLPVVWPVFILAIGVSLHLFLRREARQLGELCAEREAMLNERQARHR